MYKLILFGTRGCEMSMNVINIIREQTGKAPTMVDVFKKPDEALKYGIEAYPTLVMVKDDGTTPYILGDICEVDLIEWLDMNDYG